MKKTAQASRGKPISGWFKAPVFDGDDAKTRRAGWLNEVINMSLVFICVVMFGAVIGDNVPAKALAVGGVWFVTLVLGRYLLRKGLLGLAIGVMSTLFFISIVATIASLGTILTPITSVFVFWVILIGMLFQLPAIAMAIAASSLAVLGLIHAENAGWLPVPNFSVGLTQWIVFTAVIGMTAAVAYSANRHSRLLLAQAEVELAQRRRTEALLRTVIDNMPDPVLLKDEQSRFTLVNQALATLYSTTSEDMIGKSDGDFGATAEMIEGYQKNVLSVLSSREAQVIYEDAKDALTGEIRHYRSVKTPILDSRGQRQVLVVAQDITVQKLMNEELQLSAAALREQERNLRNIINSMPALIGYWDKHQNNQFGNQAYAQWFGVEPAALPGTHIRAVLGEALYQQNLPQIESVLQGNYQRFERAIDMPDGKSSRQVLAEYVPDLVDGQVQGFYAMVFDVSDLYLARQAAQAATTAKSQFLATMSHELRTPMNGILGMAQLLSKSGMPEAERQQYAKTILDSGRTLLQLLNDILDLSKVEAGMLTLETVAFDASAVVNHVHALFAEQALANGLQLASQWQGPMNTHYLGDPTRLRQMVSNLVSNAIKFTAQGRAQLQATEIARDGHDAVLEFSVTDTGMGIPQDKLATLFQPFSQVDSSTTRHFGGTGLGLSIVRSLAEQMGGSVGVESTVDAGSRFWFRIRLKVDTTHHPGGEIGSPMAFAPSQLPSALPAQKRNAHILVAEDSVVNRVVIQALLDNMAPFDMTLEMTENGQQALDYITRGGTPDAVLMDMQMPVMDGLDATAKIRQWEALHNKPHLPIIALTANAYEEDRRACLNAGMDDFLAKPLDATLLEAILLRWLG